MGQFTDNFIANFTEDKNQETNPGVRDFSGALAILDQDEVSKRERRIKDLAKLRPALEHEEQKDLEVEEDVSFLTQVGDFFKSIPEGFQQEINDVAEFAKAGIIDQETGEVTPLRFDIEQPETIGGSLGFTAGQLATFAVPIAAGFNAARAPRAIQAMLSSAGVSTQRAAQLGAILSAEGAAISGAQLAFNPEDPTIANLINEYPQLENPITQYLATDPTDSDNINRFKQVVTDMGLAAVLTPVFSVVGRGLSKFKQSKEAAQELTGAGSSDRTKQFLFEEYLKDKMSLKDSITNTRQSLNEGSIDDIVSDSTGRNPEDVYAEMKKDPLVRQRILARQILENQGVDPVMASHNVAKFQKEGKLDEFINATTGQNSEQWLRMSDEPEKVIIPEDPTQSAFVSKLQRGVAEAVRPSMIIDEIQRKLIGFGSNPSELKRTFDSGTFKSTDLAKTPAVMADQLANKAMARVHSFLDVGERAIPVLPSRVTANSASPLSFGGKSLGNIFTENQFTPKEIDEFLTWVQSERSMILQSKGIPNVLQFKKETPEVIFKGRNNPKFQNILEEYTTTIQGVLKYARRSGLLSKEDVDNIIASAKSSDGQYFYAPLFVNPESVSFNKATRKGNAFKAIKGNLDVELMNPLESMSQYVSSTIYRSEVNNAKQSFFNLVDKMKASTDPQSKEYANQLASRVTPASLKQNKDLRIQIKNSVAQLIRETAEKGDASLVNSQIAEISSKDLKDMDLDELLKLAPNLRQIEAGGKFYDVVFRNGKGQLYEIKDPALREYTEWLGSSNVYSLNNSTSFIGRALSKPLETSRDVAKLYGAFVTKFPAFAAANFLRDTVSASANSPFAFVPLFSSVKGLKNSLKNKNTYREMALAGATGATRGETIPRLIKDIDKITKAEGVSAVTKRLQENAIRRWFARGKEGYDEFITRMEMASRVAEYELARKHGMSPELSALFANEVSVNFMKRGSNKALNTWADMTPFLNASLQGVHKMMRTARRQPGKLGGVVAGYMLWEFMNDDFSRQYDEYKAIDESTKSLYTIIPIFSDIDQAAQDIVDGKLPELDKDTPFFLMPSPHDIGFVAKAGVNAIRDVFSEDARDDMMKAFGRMVTDLMPGVGTPTVLSPMFQKATNRDQFGNEIIPSYMDVDYNMERMYRPSTNALAVRISEASKFMDGLFKEGEGQAFVHPLMADHLINFFTPGILGAAKNAADIVSRDSDVLGERIETLPGAPSKSARPEVFALEQLTGRFALGTSELRAGEQILFDLRDSASSIRKGERNIAKQIDDRIFNKEVVSVDGTERKLKDIYPSIKRMSDLVGMRNQQRREIESNRVITGEEKTLRITELERIKKQELIRFLNWLEKVDPEKDLRKVTKQGSTKPLLFGK